MSGNENIACILASIFSDDGVLPFFTSVGVPRAVHSTSFFKNHLQIIIDM